MKIKTLTALSAIALTMAAPAYADTIQFDASGDITAESTLAASGQTESQAAGEGTASGWRSNDTAASETTEDTQPADTAAEGAQDDTETVRAAVIESGGESSEMTYVTVAQSMTVEGMLDSPVYNTNGETIGNVDDIIIGQNGAVKSVVVSHGGFLGLGEDKSAFEYSTIMRQQADGDVIIPVAAELVDQAPIFVYSQDEAEPGENVQVMAQTDLRASKLLNTDVMSPQDEAVAQVENITLQNGEVKHLIVSVDEAAGTANERAALDFENITKTQTEDGIQLKMSSDQFQKFEEFMQLQLSSN